MATPDISCTHYQGCQTQMHRGPDWFNIYLKKTKQLIEPVPITAYTMLLSDIAQINKELQHFLTTLLMISSVKIFQEANNRKK